MRTECWRQSGQTPSAPALRIVSRSLVSFSTLFTVPFLLCREGSDTREDLGEPETDCSCKPVIRDLRPGAETLADNRE